MKKVFSFITSGLLLATAILYFLETRRLKKAYVQGVWAMSRTKVL